MSGTGPTGAREAPRTDASTGSSGRLPAAVAVLGAGTMGHGIAQMAALAGCRVRLHDIREDALEVGVRRIRDHLHRGVALGKVEPEAREAALARLAPTTDLMAATEGVDAVIEAVPERLELKREVLGAAARSAAPGATLATNTSALSITAIAAGLPAPERVVGMHFFNPVHIMELVEVVRGERTSEKTVARATALAEAMGKTPIVVRDSPGFASSRLGVALGLEAIRMLEEEVASAEDIDRAMTLGYRHPIGPLRLTDLVGLDVRLEIARHLRRALDGARFEPPVLLERMVEEGKLGKKTGRGFYVWDER